MAELVHQAARLVAERSHLVLPGSEADDEVAVVDAAQPRARAPGRLVVDEQDIVEVRTAGSVEVAAVANGLERGVERAVCRDEHGLLGDRVAPVDD